MEINGTELTMTPELMAAIQAGIQKFMEADMAKKADSFRQLNQTAQKGGIVFAGDSITEGYPVYELFTRELTLYNRGISGINSLQLLENLDAHVLDLKPESVVLLIGTNDIGQGYGVEETAGRIWQICGKIEEECRDARIYLLSVYPVYDIPENSRAVGVRDNETLKQLNKQLEKAARGSRHVKYLDLYPTMTDERGRLKESYTTDGLHLSMEGYRHVTQLLSPYVSVMPRSY